MKIDFFIKKKNDMGDTIKKFRKNLIVSENSHPKWLRNENDGENETLESY